MAADAVEAAAEEVEAVADVTEAAAVEPEASCEALQALQVVAKETLGQFCITNCVLRIGKYRKRPNLKP